MDDLAETFHKENGLIGHDTEAQTGEIDKTQIFGMEALPHEGILSGFGRFFFASLKNFLEFFAKNFLESQKSS